MLWFFLITPLVITTVAIFVPRTVLRYPRLRTVIVRSGILRALTPLREVREQRWKRWSTRCCELGTAFAEFGRAVKACFRNDPAEQGQEKEIPPDLAVLNCRVRITDRDTGDSIEHLFTVEVCGSIRAPQVARQVILGVGVEDITDGPDNPMPVQTAIKQHRAPETGEFLFTSSMGRLPEQVTVMNDWTTVAQIPLDWLILPRRGSRKLLFRTSLMASAGEQPFANAHHDFDFDNYASGYLDMAETVQRTKTLAVPLVLAFCADSDKAVQLVREWTYQNVGYGPDSPRIRKKIDKALEKSAEFFRHGNTLDTEGLCVELADVAPMAQRYEILDLCLDAAQARGSLSDEDLTRLQNMAQWLGADAERFRSMLESTIPLEMRKEADVDKLLGITPDMDKAEARRQLNSQFRKWHSRITHSDSQIRAQADHMLELIAQARSRTLSEAGRDTAEAQADKALVDLKTAD